MPTTASEVPTPRSRSRRIYDFVVWTADPTRERLQDMITATDDDVLVAVMQTKSAPEAARLAWAIYGHRRQFVDFAVQVSETRDGLRVSFDGYAKPGHVAPHVRRYS